MLHIIAGLRAKIIKYMVSACGNPPTTASLTRRPKEVDTPPLARCRAKAKSAAPRAM